MITENFKIPMIQDLEKIVIDITKNFDFTCLEVRSTSKDKFYRICNKKENYFGETFILTDQPLVQRRCTVTLIEDENKKLHPRFEFFIWDKTVNRKIKEINEPNDGSDDFLRIKARVELEKDGSENFWKLISFLATVKEIELKNFGSYKIVDSNAYISEFKTKKEFEKIEELKKIFSDPNFNEDIVKKALLDTRKKNIDEFRKLLEDDGYIEIYRKDKSISVLGDEVVWHHFLKNNDWILGLNVDIRFINDFTDEVNLGVQNTANAGSPKTDLLGISDYTILIELKTANKEYFTAVKKSTSRANTWSFSNDLIDGVSQCLGQKFDWDKQHKSKDLIDCDNNIIDQNKYRTVDPKTILIMGNKQKELPIDSSNGDISKKRDTLERFRRNNRNVEIISFDELYERAYFIIYNDVAPKLNFDTVGEDFNSVPF